MSALFAVDVEAQARADALAKLHLAHRATTSALEAVRKLERRTIDADVRNRLGPAQDCLAAAGNLVEDVTMLVRDGQVILRRGLVGQPGQRATFVSANPVDNRTACDLYVEIEHSEILDNLLKQLCAEV